MPLSLTDIQTSNHWLANVVEINRRVKITLEGVTGLTVTQFRAMLELRVSGDQLACGALATLLFVSPSAVTHALDDLADRGYVARTSMASNRRIVLANLTQAGIEAFERANSVLVEMLQREAWSELSGDELSRLVYATSLSAGLFSGRILTHPSMPVEPCYIGCAIIQQVFCEQTIRKQHLGMPEFRLCVFALGTPRGFVQSEACEELLMDRRAISRAALGLKKRGILKDVENADKSGLLSLSAEGRALTVDLVKQVEQVDTKICVSPQSPSVEELNHLSELVYRSLRATFEG